MPCLWQASRACLPLLSLLWKTATVIMMDEKTLLGQLEDLARSLSIEVRYEPFKGDELFSSGGLCKLKGQYLLIINSKSSNKDKIEALATAVNRFDLSQVYLRPGLRAFLEGFPKSPQAQVPEA
jgi:hypothetical protein